MNGNSYVDIFASKGIEYILALGFLAALIIFWKFLNTPARRLAVQPTVVPAQPALEKLAVADNLFYAPGHRWVALDAGGTVSVGVDSFLGRLIGRFEKLDMVEPGTEIRKGDPIFRIAREGRMIAVPSPFSGTVSAVNDDLTAGEAAVDMEGESWIARIKPNDLARGLYGMKIGSRARAWLDEELARLRDFFSSLSPEAATAGQTLLDGGFPAEGALWMLSDEEFEQFIAEFLGTD
jgi:glycine cleavage system H lipoate-binding protein